MPALIADTLQIEDFLGGTLTAAERQRLAAMQVGIEAQIRRLCGWNISQQTRVEYHPKVERSDAPHPLLGGDLHFIANPASVRQGLDVIQLDEGFVRSVASVKINVAAAGHDSDFDDIAAEPATTYRLNVDEHNATDDTVLCRDGQLIRIGGAWPTRSGSVRVQYTNGFTAVELTELYPDILFAIVEEVAMRFRASQPLTTQGGAYPVSSKRIQDYAVTYATDMATTGQVSRGKLSTALQDALWPWMHLQIGV